MNTGLIKKNICLASFMIFLKGKKNAQGLDLTSLRLAEHFPHPGFITIDIKAVIIKMMTFPLYTSVTAVCTITIYGIWNRAPISQLWKSPTVCCHLVILQNSTAQMWQAIAACLDTSEAVRRNKPTWIRQKAKRSNMVIAPDTFPQYFIGQASIQQNKTKFVCNAELFFSTPEKRESET